MINQQYTTNTYPVADNIRVNINGTVVCDTKTDFQKILILDTQNLGRCLFLDNVTQLSERDEYMYHEGIVHPALLSHENPKRILVIGGGDGGTLRELLKHPIESITLFELDPGVVDACRPYLRGQREVFDNPRIQIKYGDGKKLLQESDIRFDVIILDLTDPKGPSKYLFTKEFYELVKERLEDEGVMVIDADSPDFEGCFPNIVKTVESVFAYVYPFLIHIPSYFMQQGFAICSKSDLGKMRSEHYVQKQLYSRRLDLKLFNAFDITLLFSRTHFINQLMKGRLKISTDDDPMETRY